MIESLCRSMRYNASGGKSGSAFAKTLDGRFILKYCQRIELKSFLEIAPAYFDYMSKSLFHGLPSVCTYALFV